MKNTNTIINTLLCIVLALILVKLLNISTMAILLILMVVLFAFPIIFKFVFSNDARKRFAQEYASVFGGSWFVLYFKFSSPEMYHRAKLELEAYRVLVVNGFYHSDIALISKANTELLKYDVSIVQSKISILLNIVYATHCSRDDALALYKNNPKEAAKLSDIAMARSKK